MSALAIVASGLVSGLGFNAAANWAAMRARLSALRGETLHDIHSGEPISIARAPLPHWWEGPSKLADLLAPALLECLRAAEAEQLAPARLAAIPLILTLGEPERAHRPAKLDAIVIDELVARLGPLHPASLTLERGRSGGVIGLDLAAALLREGKAPACIVAGVDSFLQLELVRELVERRRVVTPLNSNGFFPGEAGAAVLVAPARHRPSELHVLGLGLAHEPATLESDQPLRGEGLTGAVRAALQAADMTMLDVGYRLSDINGERYKFKESTLMFAKLDRKVDARGRVASPDRKLPLWHPIEHLGEIGAAIVPCLLGLALEAGRRGWAPGDTALLHVGDELGDRAAAIVRHVAGPKAPATTCLGRVIHEW